MAKVMIVDDSLFMRNQITKMLSKQGHDTVVAENGIEAINTYRKDNPDVVVMDITMPQMDGLEALLEIREYDPNARVIMLTALDQKMAAARAIHLGARDFLVKPVPPTQLVSALHKALG
jgi:two-component system chemotaxis response regulator CheY